MSLLSSPRFLRILLWTDALSAAGTAVLQLATASWLAGVLGLPMSLLRASGAGLWLFVLGAAWLARGDPAPPRGVRALALANAGWAAACLGLWSAGSAATPLGQAYLLLQAAAVGGLGGLQWLAARPRRRPVAA